jgi:CubicO group peptidase (beta-lactamase class C family)
VEALARAADYSDSHSGRAMLVMKDGQVIFERYARGWTAERPHPLASGTKSFAGVTAAAAVTDGLISLDEYVADTITEWKSDARASRITVRQLLQLTSGLEPNSELLGRQGYGIRDLGRVNNLAGVLRGGAAERAPENWYAAVVKVPVTREPGTAFRYGASHFYAWGEFLSRKLAASDRPERSYWQYMRARVLQPAGIDIAKSRFALDQAGNPNLPGGAHLTAREWAAFGEFVRRGCTVRSTAKGGISTGGDGGGDGGGEAWIPVIDRDALEQCFVGSTANPQYGLTWWLLTGADGSVAQTADEGGSRRGLLRRLRRGGQPQAGGQTEAVRDANGTLVKAVMAAGAGKQRLYLLPEQGMVVVRLAEMTQAGQDFSDPEFLRLLLDVR